ncbi:adenosine receptor A1-like [Alosa sapidissima]|uniref:adenosine receptor A1-like n=1 Tax=Alosa sapidissima TaxID=34773 RepID=UPI001C08EDDD|nr:adenosine receptor A1-like [Alosa sapidissima]
MADHITKVLFTVLEVLIAVACCLGNLLVIWAVWKCGAMRRQATFCLIISLAVADFLVGAVVVPLRVVTDNRVQMPFYSCLSLTCMVMFLTRVPVFCQLALTVDRFLRVIIPLRYKTTVTVQRSWWVVAACWLTAATVGFTPFMGWNNLSSKSQNMTHCQFLSVMSLSYMVYIYFYTCFLIPMLVMTTLYGCIFTIIHRQLRKTSTGVSSSYYYKERNLTRSLVLVLVLFAVCWLPIHLMDMADFHGLAVPIEAFYVGILLSQANSAINPIIYALKIQHIRAPLKTIWRKVFLCKEEVEAPRSSQIDQPDIRT